ncbi:hypothetical protein C8J56DRAFT_950348 [Mycena floridula]|nr:hypothetical protein C8J56DRAFT_963834 [Mycena floridula]KAJ7585312.1 hypothetical protein C8J56DRAFT_950348 [Mycena floridula]
MSLNGIARLPVEILSQIFIEVVPQARWMLESDSSWIWVSHVCRHWRRVALACPKLWSTISLSYPIWTALQIQRSKQSLLSIGTYGDEQFDAMRAVLITQMGRVERLELDITADSMETLVSDISMAGLEAPFLHSFEAYVSEDEDVDPFIFDKLIEMSQSSASRSFFNSNHFRELILANVPFSWSICPDFRNLTKLSIEGNDLPSRPEFAVFLDFLSSVPRLQELELKYSAPDIIDGQQSGHDNVQLPALRKLTVHDDKMKRCTAMLFGISRSLTLELGLSCTLDQPNWKSFLQGVRRHVDKDSPFTDVRVGLPRSQITFSGDTGKEVWVRLNGCQFVDFPLVTCDILDLFSLSRVTKLEVLSPGWLSSEMSRSSRIAYRELWVELGRLDKVQVLRLVDEPPVLLTEILLNRAMGCTGFAAAGRSDTQVEEIALMRIYIDHWHLLPDLRRIELSGIVCDSLLPTKRKDSTPTTFADIILALLWARRASRRPLTSIMMKHCLISSCHRAQMALFVDVEWEGKPWTKSSKISEEEFASQSFRTYERVLDTHARNIPVGDEWKTWMRHDRDQRLRSPSISGSD